VSDDKGVVPDRAVAAEPESLLRGDPVLQAAREMLLKK